MAEWSDWIQDVAKTTLNTAIEVKYKQPFELQRMQLAAMSPFGLPYMEGQAQAPGGPVSNVGGIPTTWLIVGGIVAVVLLAD